VAPQLTKTGADEAEPRPSYEQIAALAYAFWEQRGRPEGSADEDWFNAEAALNQPSAVETGQGG
jgi:hypothetical protein